MSNESREPRPPSVAHSVPEIEALRERDREATRALDAEALVDLWTGDGAGIGPGGRVVRGREALAEQIRRSAEAAAGQEVLAYEQTFEDLSVAGEWAWEMGRFESVTRDPATGHVTRVAGPMLRILRRQADGSWRFHRSMWTPEDEA